MTDETHDAPPPSPDEPAFPGLATAPPAGASAAPAPYRVLARKYRPRSFDDLIGQEAMVRTLSNAFATGRIPQAWMLTGVRGVGKTTTARILARGLNYEREDGSGGPTIDLKEMGRHCEAIVEGRHIDVLEIDAASNNGVDNIRQISDAVRYAPVSARYKVYIVDEVHMLSTAAFNAFLKTLEEPPPHAKFVFATTEIHKVPVTILSRCQRFDLKRVPGDTLVAHLAKICGLEGVEVEPEALTALARAAEGSVRDSLSLLDQAIAHGAGVVTAQTVRDMLGLADRAKIIDLFEAVMRGDVETAFGALKDQYDNGADPAMVLQELASFTHLTTRMKLVPQADQDPTLSQEERTRASAYAQTLSVRALSRAWQILLKAIPEVSQAPRPMPAAEMVLVRLAYAADLPTPDEALRMLKDGSGAVPASPPAPSRTSGTGDGPSASLDEPPIPPAREAMAASGGGGARAPLPSAKALLSAVPSSPRPEPSAAPVATPTPAAVPAVRLARFEDLVAFVGERRDVGLKRALECDVRLVHYEDGRLEFALAESGRRDLPNEISRKLGELTGRRWIVALSREEGAPPLAEVAAEAARERRRGAQNHPLVQSVLASFPGAQIVDVRDRAPAEDDEEAPNAGGISEAAEPMAPPPEDEEL
ncbi:DNA polymerase III subunit gamma/tau [Salinarimonas ramus]|uniref:DNA polymerase III subunit gamma/tau n=1 Tax=Salinarimonas ramus TaxID=690164 RepID=A0A917QBA2_9HYPH|nr:DNA polymerase III subunit gamma/tau [Salinarimonas ramus]GGK41004.1 DNA polymerase III subunit gamma/tau [Salinarimonas ramus]